MDYELNPTNAFGEVLLDLMEAQYQGDYNLAMSALVQVTGMPEQTLAGIINGDFVVTDTEILASLMEAFPDADEQDLSIVVTVASGVEEADRGDTTAFLQDQAAAEQQEQYAGTEGGADYASSEGDGAAEGSFAYRGTGRANFAQNKLAAKVNQLETYIANFAAESQLSGTLDRLHNTAINLESNGYLPPAYRRMLVGDFANSKDRVARFSQMAVENGVDLGTMLFAAEYALGVIGEGGKYVEFQDHSLSSQDVAVAQFSAGLDHVVANDFDAIFNY